jgi:hypothetical protein
LPEIRVTKDGPYLVSGDLPIAKATIGANAEGESIRWEWAPPLPAQKNAALCRCGHSVVSPIATARMPRSASTAPRRQAASLTPSRRS